MPASTPASPSEPQRLPSPLRGDGAGVSEVLGHILIFGIVAMLLVSSMLAFNVAQTAARDRVVGLRAESAATRVAGVVVQTSIVQERQGVTASATAQVRFLVDLPQQFEGLSYTLSLVATAGSVAAHVRVQVPSDHVDVSAALFSADAPSGIGVCASSAPGGPVYVAFDTLSSCSGTCTAPAVAPCPYLYVKSVP
ncbi:MAG: hypothetical protein QOI63_1024 [Thermoplasmata archaeon]|jgi:hypothetical protein|nr:hypothetical protein [Thermoplasmata archaeon]